MKVAASLDGKTALNNGRSQWITGEAARRDGHHWRARACAILTGAGTVRDDDPRLTVRDVGTTRQPLRVVVDSKLETPPAAKILDGGGVLVAAAQEDKPKIAALRARGAEVIVMPNSAGKVELGGLFRELARREVNEVHVEAGRRDHGAGDEENRVAGQEREHHQSRFREDHDEQQRVKPRAVLSGHVRERLVEREQRVEQRCQHGRSETGGQRARRRIRYGSIFSPPMPAFLSGLTRSSRETPIHITSGAITSTDE